MKVTVTFTADQAALVQAYLARSPYRTAEEWLSDLIANVLAPYAMTLPTSGPIKTLMDQRQALEQSIRSSLKPIAALDTKAQAAE